MGYSARINLELIVNGQVIDVVQTAPDRLTLRDPATLPAGEATLVITIDDKRHVTPIIMSETTDSRIVRFW